MAPLGAGGVKTCQAGQTVEMELELRNTGGSVGAWERCSQQDLRKIPGSGALAGSLPRFLLIAQRRNADYPCGELPRSILRLAADLPPCDAGT